jgi:hypothetical protein
MINQQGTTGVNRARTNPFISDGELILARLPWIRESIRYHSNRWEIRENGAWRPFHRSVAHYHLTCWRGRFRLHDHQAERVLFALRQEYRSSESKDENPVLRTFPELRTAVRERHMPNVRRFFCYRGRTYYERCGAEWLPVSLSRIHSRIFDRIFQECIYWITPISHVACIEELKLEEQNGQIQYA